MIRVKIQWTYPVVPYEIEVSGEIGITFGGEGVLGQVLEEIRISSMITPRTRRPFDGFRG